MTTERLIANGAITLSARHDKTWWDLVKKAEYLTLADSNEPLNISALCLALAVSERTLRKAFHRTHGLPPCRHLRLLRLSRARRALLGADCELTTVTEIATHFGFVELGRFSVEYRKRFGESPSQTLSRASTNGVGRQHHSLEQPRLLSEIRATASANLQTETVSA
jgi:AraC-like DNA-binding protein